MLILSLGFTFGLQSCGDSSSSEQEYKPASYTVKGKVEKGPFISGSTINMQPMNAKLQPNGSTFSTTITDHSGNFSFASATLDAPFAQLTANGYFFNEVTGTLSSGTLSLRALANLAEQSTVNVNLLTHLKYSRILDLVEKDNKSYAEANKQAQKELLTAFGLQKYADTDASRYSITSGTPEAGALIAISSMILKNRSEAQVTEYLAKLSNEFGRTGTFSVDTKTTMKKDRNALINDLHNIENNIVARYEELGQNVKVVPLEYYFDWNDDGIAGNEIYDPKEPPTLSQTEINVPKEGGEYTVNIDSKVQLYLESQYYDDGPQSIITQDEIFWNSLYDREVVGGSVVRSIDGKTLKISVSKTQTKANTTTEIPLCDYVGNVVAKVTVTQAGDQSLPLPGLGRNGQLYVAGAFSYLSSAMDYMATDVNDYSSQSGSKLKAPLSTSNGIVSNIWNKSYTSLNQMLYLDAADKQLQSAFTAPISVFNAIIYYNMVVLWGGVPYITEYNPNGYMDGMASTSQSAILSDLQSKLEEAIPVLDEKKNSYATANDAFFVSKDVVRILLADIYMYQGAWNKALPLLSKVVSNGYYADSDIILGYNKQTDARTEIIPFMSYADVLLSLAECEYKAGNTTSAWQYAKRVAESKRTFSGTTAPTELLEYISAVRKISLSNEVGRFAFLKRTGLAKSELGLQDYQLLFPIPQHEIQANPYIRQNPGY